MLSIYPGRQFARAILVLVLARLLALPPTPLSAEVLAYVPQPAASQVTVFNTDSGSVVTQVPVGGNPIGVATDTAMQTVYVTNSASGTVSVIDMRTQTVINTIRVGQAPIGVAVTPDGSRVYVANAADNTVSWFSAQTATPAGPSPASVTINTISGLAQQPYGVAASSDGQWIYVTLRNANRIAVISTASNKVTSTLPTAALPAGIAETRIAYKRANCENVNCPARTQPLLLSADSGSGLVSAFNAQSNETFPPIPTGVEPLAVGTFPFVGSPAYIANNASQSLTVISAKPVQAVGVLNYSTMDIPLPASPTGVNGTPDGQYLWTVNNDGTMSQVSTVNDKVVQSVPIGMPGSGLGQFIAPRFAPDFTPLLPGVANLGVQVDKTGSILSIHNAGPNIATAAELTVSLPAGVQFISVRASQGGCAAPAFGSAGQVKCGLGQLAAGETAAVELAVYGAAGTLQATVADAFSADIHPANNARTWSVDSKPTATVPPVIQISVVGTGTWDPPLKEIYGAIQVRSGLESPFVTITLPPDVLPDPAVAKGMGCEFNLFTNPIVLKCPVVEGYRSSSLRDEMHCDNPVKDVCAPGADLPDYNANYSVLGAAQVLYPLTFNKTKEAKSGMILNTPITVTLTTRDGTSDSIDTTLGSVSLVTDAKYLGWLKIPSKCEDPDGVNIGVLLGSCDDSQAIKLAQMISVILAATVVSLAAGPILSGAAGGALASNEATEWIVMTAGNIIHFY